MVHGLSLSTFLPRSLLSTFSNVSASWLHWSHIQRGISDSVSLALTFVTHVCLWFLMLVLNYLPVRFTCTSNSPCYTPCMSTVPRNPTGLPQIPSHWRYQGVLNTQLSPYHSRQLTSMVCSSNRTVTGSLACFSEKEAMELSDDKHVGFQGQYTCLWILAVESILFCLCDLGWVIELLFLSLLIHKNRDNNSNYLRVLCESNELYI